MKLTASDLPDLSSGAVFLATGGGGDPYVARLVAEKALETYGAADIIDPDELDDDAYVVTIGGVGAPTASLELLPSLGAHSGQSSCITSSLATEYYETQVSVSRLPRMKSRYLTTTVFVPNRSCISRTASALRSFQTLMRKSFWETRGYFISDMFFTLGA